MANRCGYPIKIVRDRIPEFVSPSGQPGELFYGRVADDEEWSELLRRKLGEEAIEYAITPVLIELMQVLAVVEGLARLHHGLTLEELTAGMRKDPRGGYLAGVVMFGYHSEHDEP